MLRAKIHRIFLNTHGQTRKGVWPSISGTSRLASKTPTAQEGLNGSGAEPAHLEELSVSQLKSLLDRAGVDYRDCFEREELKERLKEKLGVLAQAASEESFGELQADERQSVGVFRDCSPSVVNIKTSTSAGINPLSLNMQEIPQGSGSGVVWDEKGHIATNYHVIVNASRATVILNDNTQHDARLVGYEADKDLAVLRINAKENAKPIRVGSSKPLQVGQRIYAIGNPFGLDSTLTQGIVSGVGRDIQSLTGRTIRDVIQVDAAINPGNSGGALLDSQGRLIGINTLIYSPSGAFAGVGFAVPVDTVRRVVMQLIKHGRVVRPYLGVKCAPDAISKRLGIRGVIVASVQAGSGAAAAGLMPVKVEGPRMQLGDIIYAVDGKKVESVEDLLSEVEAHDVGDTVTLSMRRYSDDGPPVETKVRLTQADSYAAE